MSFVISDNDLDSIHFLYKLSEGICEKSFAFNVARLAGIPEDLI